MARKPARRISEALKARGVQRLVYFHTDHFEPWRHVPGRPADMALAARDVERFVRASETIEYARRPSLFLKSNINFAVDDARALHRAAPEDRLGFVPRAEPERTIGRAIMAPLVAGAADIQVHIHHEHFVWNGTLKDSTTRDYLETPAGMAYGPARLELAVRLNLDLIREDGGPALDRWFFIHGHWAINASDPDECTVVREIELLMRNGCRGDFSQPAGRPHVDGRVAEPCLVRPVPVAKGYDTPAADPIRAYGAGTAPGRFFLWNTALDHRSASIDAYSQSVLRRARQPEAFGLAQAQDGVLLGGTLYVKTHSHSMAPQYWTEEGGGRFPHAHPAIQAELRTLFDAANGAGVEVAFATATEVHDEIVGAEAAPAPAANAEALTSGSPMDRLGTTIVYRDAAGSIVPAPPLPFRAPRLAPPGPARPGAALAADTPLPAIIAVAQAGEDGGPPAGSIADETIRVPAGIINDLAARIVLARLKGDEAERRHLTGFYVTRAWDRTLLQPAEQALAAAVLGRFGTAPVYWEIGCGIGLLSMLLAACGGDAVGIERNDGRVAAAEAIAAAVLEAGVTTAGRSEWIAGKFPTAIRKRHSIAHDIALVTNLLGGADQAEQHRFIAGLRRFGHVIVDVQRFFTRRQETAEWDALIAEFRAAGFPPPELFLSCGGEGHYLLFGPAQLGLFRLGDWPLRLDRWRSRWLSAPGSRRSRQG